MMNDERKTTAPVSCPSFIVQCSTLPIPLEPGNRMTNHGMNVDEHKTHVCWSFVHHSSFIIHNSASQFAQTSRISFIIFLYASGSIHTELGRSNPGSSP